MKGGGKLVDKLNERQRRFADEYIISGVAYSAAIKAGYSPKYAKTNSHKMLEHPEIKKILLRLVSEKVERESVSKSKRTVTIDSDVFSLLSDYSEEYEDIKDLVNEILLEKLVRTTEDTDKYLKSRRRGTVSEQARYEVFYQAGFRCEACGDSPKKNLECTLEVDHITPYSHGGIDHMKNYQCLCKRCNTSKGNRYAIDNRK